MNTPLEPSTEQPQAAVRSKQAPRKKSNYTYLYVILGWALLVGGGIWGGKLYTDHIRAQIAEQIAAQTEASLAEVKQQYEQELSAIKQSIDADMTEMQAKIDAVNELLSFTKDSASSKTDNSNQLYSQLADVKKQLDELKKNLDVLK